MKFKKGVIIICLLICLLGIASVSASDVNYAVVAVDEQNDDLMEIENQDDVGVMEEDVLSASAGTFSDLANEIANAKGELNLTRNYVYNNQDSSYKDGIQINKKVTINGNGFTINGKYEARTFKVLHDDVILSNIRFINSKASDEGAAILWSGDDGTLRNCNFLRCSVLTSSADSDVDAFGGAISWRGDGGTLANCSFTDCSVSSLPLDSYKYSHSEGGAVYWDGLNGVMSNSHFVNCFASSSGSDSLLSSNDDSRGGAVCWNGDYGHIYDCSFLDCSALSTGSSYGGAVYVAGYDVDNDNDVLSGNVTVEYDCILSGCNFVNCSAESGGAVYWYDSNGVLADCSFLDCSASSSSLFTKYSEGGAVYWYGWNGYIYNCSFLNCSALSTGSSYGGAVYWYGDAGYIYNSSFLDCSALSTGSSYGGAVYWNAKYGFINYCSFVNCSAYKQGGAIYWFGSGAYLLNSTFVNCIIEWYGGAVYMYSYDAIIEYCNFVYNLSYSHAFDGNAIYWYLDEGTLRDCTFIDLSTENIDHIVCGIEPTNCKFILNPFISANPVGINYGEDAVIVVDLKSDVPGYVRFTVNGATQKIKISNGKATFTVSNLDIGIYDVSVYYAGNYKYAEYTINTFIKVFKPSPFISVSPVTVKYGQDATITVNLYSDVPGNVRFTINGVSEKAKITNGIATYTVSGLNYGLYPVDIYYGGNYKYGAETISTTLKVNKNSPITSVVAKNIGYGNDEVITVNVAPNVAGNIHIKVNGVTQKAKITKGVATATFSGLNIGAYDVEAKYAGNVNYVAQTKTTSFNVIKGTPIISVSAPDTQIGSNAKITVNLANDVPGNVWFTVNGVSEKVKITNAKATYTVSGLNIGSYEVNIRYGGNVNYNAQTVKTTLNIVKIDPITSVSVNNIKVGNDAVVSVKLAKNVNGFVKITVNGITQRVQIVDGQAIATFSGLREGTYTVSAVYAGSANFNAQTKTTSLSVTKNAAALRGYKSIVDGKVVIKATIASDATGNVRLIVGDTTYVAKITNGVAIFNPLDIPSGTVVTLTYGGNYKYTAQTKTLTI